MSDTAHTFTGNIAAAAPARVRDYIDLLKPRVMSLVVFTGLVGVLIATAGRYLVTSLVQGEAAPRDRGVLERTAHHPGAHHGPPVVGEGSGAGGGQLEAEPQGAAVALPEEGSGAETAQGAWAEYDVAGGRVTMGGRKEITSLARSGPIRRRSPTMPEAGGTPILCILTDSQCGRACGATDAR